MIPKKLLDEINLWINEGRYGNLQINFAGGKVVNVNRVESVKVEALGIVVGTTLVSVANRINVD